VSRKKGGGVQKLNPFDVRHARPKQVILGRQFKTKVGQPGQARAKSIQIRKETLLQEYKMKNKANLFLDKRIGERDAKLSAEDKMIARFTAEKLRDSGRNSIFNLGEEQDLTHGGLNINDIHKFDQPGSDDEDDNKLDAKFVSEAHFGGFMTKTDDDFKSGKGNSRKEWIDNMIAESKKRKADKKKVEDELEEKTNALDDNWRDIFLKGNLCSKMMQGTNVAEPPAYDPYDMLVKQLTFERKEAIGSQRLKTEQETIKEEKERLEKLEADRLRRMRGERSEDTRRSNAVNLEDLSDPEVKKKNKLTKKEKKELLLELLAENGVGDQAEEDGEESGEEEEGAESGEESGEDESDGEESDEEDKYSDLEENDDEQESSKEDDKVKTKSDGEEFDENEKDRYDAETKEMIEKATAELPYSFAVPAQYSEFSELVRGRTVEEIGLIVERIMKCNHPSLAEGNKEKLISFFPLLLQFIDDCATAYDEEGEGDFNLDKIGLQAVEVLTPLIFKLTAMFQADAAKCVQEVIREKFEQFNNGEGRKQLPGLDTLIFSRLVMLLFPASDYRHPVVTPTIILLLNALSNARPTDRGSFASGLFIASLLTESLQLSNRFCPEVVNFIHSIIYVSCDTLPQEMYPVPPCKGGKFLVPTAKTTGEITKLRLSDVTSVKNIDDSFRVQCLHSACVILLKLLHLYAKLSSAKEIFAPVINTIKHLNVNKMHNEVVQKIDQIQTKFNELPAKSGGVVRPAKSVKMLRMLNPEIEENFYPGEKKRKGDKRELEEQKLRYKVRMEKKGARKEIRKDMAFLANQKAKETKRKDEERREKTRIIMNQLQSQEGDYQTLQRKNNKRKKF